MSDALIDAPAPPPAGGIARVAVDVSLPHLDRPFDYRVPPELEADCVVGARVRVRFAGRLVDGFVLARPATSEVATLAPLQKVVSPEPVLSPAVAALCRAVADHYAGVLADVLRLAVPPRHATTEKAARRPAPGRPGPVLAGPLGEYPTGAELVGAVAAGRSPRASWLPVAADSPAGDWAAGLAQLAAAARASGRGAILLAPDARDVDRLAAACTAALGERTFVVMTADQGPAARYRAFLAARRGEVDVVVGTRAAAFAPVDRLGLIALWDDGDDLYAEPRAPYPHARGVASLRAAQEGAALVLAGHAQSADAAALAERGWLRTLALPPADARRAGPAVRIAVDSDAALQRDPAAAQARLPGAAFAALRQGLVAGPALVQVPRAGYRSGLACADCREPARCPACSGPLAQDSADAPLACRWCGRLTPRSAWRCPQCESTRLRSSRVGVERTAAELGKAFPGVPVVSSAGDKVVTAVDAAPRLVVATPGAEPRAAGGYAAVLLLDGDVLLHRADLRAGEEALRRWANAAALARPGDAGGTVVLVAPAEARPAQALVRADPAGWAARELADRGEAAFPPAVKMIAVEGSRAALAEFTEALRPPPEAALLGPVPATPTGGPPRADAEPGFVLLLRAPLAAGSALTRAVRDAVAVRSARKDTGALRVRVDPAVL